VIELCVCRSADADEPAGPTAESMSLEEQLEGTGRSLETEPPLITGSHGMSFWMFIVVRLFLSHFGRVAYRIGGSRIFLEEATLGTRASEASEH